MQASSLRAIIYYGHLPVMGKSPGKWIKTVLFGKKSAKSKLPKDITIEKKASVTAKAPPSGGLGANHEDLPPQTTDIIAGKTEIDTAASSPCDPVVLLPGLQGADGQGTTGLSPAKDAELTRKELAATKTQAAFRGYLARRAFRALKGIIRLQALVRGHLVRRQAVATLHSMQAIVKFQALIRGRKVRLSDAGLEVLKKCRLEERLGVKRADLLGLNTSLKSTKLSKNAFVSKVSSTAYAVLGAFLASLDEKIIISRNCTVEPWIAVYESVNWLVASLPAAMPLSLQYDPAESNSVWNWLERWSAARLWEPVVQQKKSFDVKPKRKQNNGQTDEVEVGRPKRGGWKVPAKNAENNLAQSSDEKPKRNARKILSHQAELVQEQPQSELEKIKRNLRKVSASAIVASVGSEAVTEKPQRHLREVSCSPTPDVAEQAIEQTSEKTSDVVLAVSKQPVSEAPSELLAVEKPLDVLHDDHPAVELLSLENSNKVENRPAVNDELSPKEDQTNKESQKTRRRRSFPVKQEHIESASQNTPTVPSYMAATESAKAKLRAQGSPNFGEDGAENGFVRRHSLPSSINGKLISMSPRMQKPAQVNGKGGSKSNRSLTSSRDGNVDSTRSFLLLSLLCNLPIFFCRAMVISGLTFSPFTNVERVSVACFCSLK
ncbi:hypothetical protein RJ640_010835 [Escallonia rubra]|uniref:DUF4005 domain-containing protein n=1 Tax=Escallonia rubra TaxID=112253 RepID=A0AA88QSP7_9ASTE|nr:hypothetical protein RJ640_010835 [Escallonia rubra]